MSVPELRLVKSESAPADRHVADRRIGLRLLGRFSATFDGQPPRLLQISALRHRALLGYLAMQPSYAETRERLASLLWGDRFDKQARQSLRQCLLLMRKDFESTGVDPLIIDRDTVGLDPERITVDAREFLTLAQSDNLDDIDRAIALYESAFLDGLELDVESFDDWLHNERARLQGAATLALQRAAERHDAAGVATKAVRAAEKLVALDPLRESGHRLLLRIVAKHHGRDAALGHAEALAHTIRNELDCDLEPQTKEVIAEIRREPTAVAAVSKAAPQATVPAAVADSLSSPDAPSIVVLPFLNLSGDPAQEYFADGATEDIITALSRLRWLLVIARNSAFVYKGKAVDVRQIARDLGVRYILEGSVRAAGQRIRITGQLIDAEKGKHIWAEKYDRQLHDIFAVQDEITQHVVAAIEPHLYAEESFRVASKPPESVDVWGLVVTAMGLVNKVGRTQNEEAQRLLRRAIEIDPGYARAHVILSWAVWWATLCYWVPERSEGYRQAARHAEDALRLDPNEPWARMTVGLSLSTAGHHERALAELQAALNFNPSFALGRMVYGWALLRAGRFDEAIAETGMALRMSPMDSFAGLYTSIHGLALLGARRFSEALPFLRASVAAFAEYSGHYNTLISCCGHLGLLEEAQEFIARRNKVGPPIRAGVLRHNLRMFAHCDVFVEGVLKAGVPE